MPDPERLLRTLDKARQCFLTTPGRRGRLVQLESVREVFVAGDLHGSVENFRLLLQQADLARNPHRHLVVQELIHGPFRYAAGGDKSHQLLDLLAALKCQYPERVHMLPGNHELAQSTDQRIGKGDEDYNDLYRKGLETAYGPHGAAVYAAQLAMIAVLPFALRTSNRVFLSHSLPSASKLDAFDPGVLELEEHPPAAFRLGGPWHALVWGRDTASKTVSRFLEKVDADLLISGHIPCDHGYATPNDRQLILDSMGTPACACLFPTDRPVSLADLIAGVHVL